MSTEFYDLEGIVIELNRNDSGDREAERRRLSYCFRIIREKSGMSRTEFSSWLGIPYRTIQEWELGRRAMPEYVLRLIAYKVRVELSSGNIG
ncbi:MAG: helix-turn-helix domain-containing protein [Saccharofermentans sp.]|nr:helix-turn-helix domain-containing protein [Saccharofermentans sp.]